MPPLTFAILIGAVIGAAGVTILLWQVADLPLVALGFAALAGTLALSWRGGRR